LGEPILQAVALTGSIWLLALLLQPFALIFKYSRGTNDTSSGCFFSLGLVGYGLLTCGATWSLRCSASKQSNPVQIRCSS
jgi:hypothetical protein